MEEGIYRFTCRHSRMVLSVEGGYNADLARIIQNPPMMSYSENSPAPNQLWRVTHTADSNYHLIEPVHTNKSLDVPRSSRENETGIIQYTNYGTQNQQWQITQNSDGFYEIVARHSGKCLDVPRSSTDTGVQIIQYDRHGTHNQQWSATEMRNLPRTQPGELVALTLRGASESTSGVVHNIVRDCIAEVGVTLEEGDNWQKDAGDGVASSRDARRIRDKINELASWNGGDKRRLSLLLFGKSAGGVLAWNTFKKYYTEDINSFCRSALVLVDAHGSVTKDSESGPYSDGQPLSWPDNFCRDARNMRVYNIFQHEEGLTGANFPSSWVYHNEQISAGNVEHNTIHGFDQTRNMIIRAARFALEGK